MKTRTILAAMLFLASQSALAQLYMLRDNSGELYRLNTVTGAGTLVATISAVTSNTIGLTEGPPGLLYGSTYQDLISFRPDGSNVVDIGPILGGQTGAEALGYCIPTNILYGAINGNFFTINQATAVKTPLASPPGNADVEGLACDHKNNVVYGLESGTGTLYRYTPGTDSWAIVGSTGVSFSGTGLAMDANAGILYGIGDQDANLYRINPQTAATAVIGPTGLGNIGGGLGFVQSVSVGVPVPALSPLALALLAVMLGAAPLAVLARKRRMHR